MVQKYNFDVDKPEEVPVALRRAAAAYLESVAEMHEVYNDPDTGVLWMKIAGVLVRAAEEIAKFAPQIRENRHEDEQPDRGGETSLLAASPSHL